MYYMLCMYHYTRQERAIHLNMHFNIMFFPYILDTAYVFALSHYDVNL